MDYALTIYLMGMKKYRVQHKVACYVNSKYNPQICEQVFHTGRKGKSYREYWKIYFY